MRVLISWAIACTLLIGLFTNLPLWFDRLTGTSLAPLIYLATVIAAVLLAAWRSPQLLKYSKDGYIIFCIVFILLYAFAALRVQIIGFPDDVTQSVFDRFERTIMLLSIAVLVFLTPHKYFKFFMPVAAMIIPTVIIVEFLNPEIFAGGEKHDEESARVAGFWGNENRAAEVTVLAIVLAARSTGKLLLASLYTIAFIAVIFTGSRAGMMGMAVVGLALLLQRRLPIIYTFAPIILAIYFTSAISLVEDLLDSTGRSKGAEGLIARITYFVSEDSRGDASSENRTGVAINGLTKSMDRPILGHATTYTDPELGIGPHNQWVDILYQFGLPGLLLWIWLAVLLARNGKGILNKLECFCLVWFSMFTHNVMDSPWWYVFLALSMSPEYRNIPKKITNPRKRSRRKRRRRSQGSNTSEPRRIQT